MLKMVQIMDIKELHQAGHSIKAIVQLTGISRNTVRKVLRGESSLERKKRAPNSCLDPYKDYITKRYNEVGLSAVRMQEEIESMGYQGSLRTLRRFITTLKPEKKRLEKVTVRFETPPGQQAQVDWGHCGVFQTAEGKRINVYVFVIVLSYSRQLYIQFTTSMKMSVLLDCHKAAFDYFQGWPKTILYDNMKSIKLSRSTWNETFIDFSNHYGFIPKTHQPYRPRTKGKVERMVDYVKGNFLTGRKFDDLSDLNAQAFHWLNHTANTRVHSTTKRIPLEAFKDEELTPYHCVKPYNFIDPVTRTVNYESMVHFQGSKYSVPPSYAGKSVSIAASGMHIVIQAENMIIAEHKQAMKAGQCIVDKDHLAELWKMTEQQIRPPKTGVPWSVKFNQPVHKTPLGVFEEVVQ